MTTSTRGPNMDKEKLAGLDKAATQGVWQTTGVMLGYKGDVFVATADRITDCDQVARFYAPKPPKGPICDLQVRQMTNEAIAIIEANAAFIAALVNAYRAGELVPVSLDADTAGLVEYTGSPELGTPDPTALRTITAERDALAKRVAELEVSVELAAVWFEGYANAHYAKAINAPDGKEQHSREVKGKTNADRAKELRATLKGTDHV